MEDLHERSVDWFAARGERTARQGACPLETWARDLRAFIDRRTEILASMHRMPASEARGMALAGLIAGRPGSWEAAELIDMVRADFFPGVELPTTDPRELSPLVGEWHTWQIDGGQVIADALARLAERGPIIPDDSYFVGTSFAMSTTA